jgi:hypothetical protein
MQRLGFMHAIEAGRENHDWIVIDECHGLFSEASFAEDAEFIASWIRSGRANNHIIFITANDDYFEELSRQYFPGNFNFIYLFPDFTKYVSHTYVKEIRFIKTNRTEQVLNSFIKENHNKKILIFLKKASDVKDWFFKMLAAGERVGMIVSQANETTALISNDEAKTAKNLALDISEGQAGLTMADLCELYDAVRKKEGKEGIREALIQERLPEDIDILFATDTLQEGISIKTVINCIIIEGFTDVEVRQKLGRFRGNLELLYIIFNPNATRHQILDTLQTFDKLQNLIQEGNQVQLAKFYGTQLSMRFATRFLVENYDDRGQPYYSINEPAKLNLLRRADQYNKLVGNTDETVKDMYSYPLLEGEPRILDFTDIRTTDMKEAILAIANKWRGIPLKGDAQNELIQDFQNAEITYNNRHIVDSFKKCCTAFEKFGIELKERQAGKKDLEQWPQYLSKPREKFKTISP